MKKPLLFFMVTVLLSMFSSVAFYANSGPASGGSGYFGTEMYVVDQKSNISVEKENLTLDFAGNQNSSDMSGKITADYEMKNLDNEAKTVKMVFPYINGNTPSVQVNGEALTFKKYICGQSRDFFDEATGKKYNFSKILGAITDKEYLPKHFNKTDIGKFYTISVTPEQGQTVFVGIQFTYEASKTKVIVSGFNGMEYDNNFAKIQSICYGEEHLELYVIGDDIKFEPYAYSDSNLTQKTDACKLKTTSEGVSIYDYIFALQKIVDYAKDMNDEIQIYNQYAKTIDKMDGFSDKGSLFAMYEGCMYALMYDVPFGAAEEKEIKVSYDTELGWSTQETKERQYSVKYLLSPANEWAAFHHLSIEVLPPKSSPYIIKSSIDFTRTNQGTYTASCQTLPESDLALTFYKDEQVSWYDKMIGDLYYRYSYFAPIVIFLRIIIVVVIIIILFVIVGKIKSKRKA